MKIIAAIAIVVLASACATPTPTPAYAPIIPTPTRSSTTTTTTSATPTVQPVTVPLDLAGRTAAKIDEELRALGFTALQYIGPDGNTVKPDSSWTVVSVEGAGSAVRPDSVVRIRVDKPAPPPPPKTSTKTTPKPAPPKTQQPAPPAAAYYKNCAAAKAAGAAPVHRGEPGYGAHLDRDGDGVGCER